MRINVKNRYTTNYHIYGAVAKKKNNNKSEIKKKKTIYGKHKHT